MLRLLFDQDFNHDILRGLFLRLPDVDVSACSLVNQKRGDETFNFLVSADAFTRYGQRVIARR